MESKVSQAGEGRKGPGVLIRGLLQVVTRSSPPAPADDGGDPAAHALPPAGHRSGRGAQSVAPYLEEARHSRPGPLE